MAKWITFQPLQRERIVVSPCEVRSAHLCSDVRLGGPEVPSPSGPFWGASAQPAGETPRIRWIRIEAGVPKQWITAPADLLLQSDQLDSFYVEVKDSAIHATVLSILQLTGHGTDNSQTCSCMRTAKVKSVHRIENWRLWQGYKSRCAALRKEHASYNISVTPAPIDCDALHGTYMTSHQAVFDCGEALAADVDEKILLHGTSWGNANSIVLNGFDPRMCDRGMYGDGVYFASAACKSHQYLPGFA